MNILDIKYNLLSKYGQILQIDRQYQVLQSCDTLFRIPLGQSILQVLPFLEEYLIEFFEEKHTESLSSIVWKIGDKNYFLDVYIDLINKRNIVFLEDKSREYRTRQKLQQRRNEYLINKEEIYNIQRSKQEFFKKINHEIRNPLQSSLYILEALKEGISPDSQGLCNTLQGNLESIVSIADSIMAIAKQERAAWKYFDDIYELQPFLQEVIERNRHLVKSNGNKLELHMPDDIPSGEIDVIMDKTRLHQVFSNLISNSNKHTKEGKIAIVLQKMEEKGKHKILHFLVEDTGVGMPKSKSEEIFKDYIQVHKHTSSQGLGLGLGIVQQIVERYGGGICAESELGKGTKMYFTLALKTPKKRPENISFQAAFSRYKVLLIDDDEVALTFISKSLEKHGLHVDTAVNVNSAKAKLKQTPYHFVFCDYYLDNNHTGFDLGAECKENMGKPIKILFTGETLDLALVQSHGFKEYMVKPVPTISLLNMIKKYSLEI